MGKSKTNQRGQTTSLDVSLRVLPLALPPKPDHQARRARVQAAGGPQRFLAARGLAELAGMDDLTETALTQTERWELLYAEARRRQCKACPPDGGACDTQNADRCREVTGQTKLGALFEPSESDVPAGLTPEWNPSGLGYRVCKRWSGYQVSRQLEFAGVDARLLHERFSSYKPALECQVEAKRLCMGFARDYARHRERGSGIFLQGDTGLGKSHLSVATLAAVLEAHPRTQAVFVYVPEFLREARPSASRPDETFHRVVAADLLVLDDLGKEAGSVWTRAQIEAVLHERARNKLPTIITTQPNIEELEHRYDPSSLRRCFQMSVVRVQFQGDYLALEEHER